MGAMTSLCCKVLKIQSSAVVVSGWLMMHQATGQSPGAGEGSPGMDLGQWLENCYSRTDAGVNDHLTEEDLSLGQPATGDSYSY